MVAAVVWGNVTGIHAATAAMDLVDTMIAVGTTGFLECEGSNSASASRVQYCTFYDRLQVSVKMQPSFCGVS